MSTYHPLDFSVVQSPSQVWLFATPWTAVCQASLSLTISQSLPRFMSIALVMTSSHLILWCFRPLLQSIFPSIMEFSNESSVHIRWPKYLELQHQCFQWVFRVDFPYNWWFELLAVQGNFRSLLQHLSLKVPILWHSAAFMVQLSQLYMTTGKIIVRTIQTFISRIMSLLFNTLSRFVIAFLTRSNHLLISRLQSTSTVILEPKKRNLLLLPFPPLFALK